MPGFPVLHYLLEFAQTHVHSVDGAIQPSHPLLPTSFPALKLSQHFRVFSSESALCIRWPKYWSFSFSISPSSEYSGWISFRMDRLIFLLFKELLRVFYHCLKASVLWCSAFFMVQLSYLYMTNGKTIALTRWTIVNKVTSLLLNTLSRLVIAFLPRRVFLILWLQSPSTVILEPKKIKSITVAIFSQMP